MRVDPPRAVDTEVAPATRNGWSLLHAVESGLQWLEANARAIDRLNVFPVPDGDTGTNMVLTMRAALAEASQKPSDVVGHVADALARGALLGARGNSGVILSQCFRGLAEGLKGHETFGPPELARGLERAYQVAYESVADPVEGTILTVARDAGTAAVRVGRSAETLEDLVGEVVRAAHASVQNTPNQLPVLKEAGVVDAGGQGLFIIFDGMLRYLRGEELPEVATQDRAADVFAAFAEAHRRDEHGFCTEFVIHGEGMDVAQVRRDVAPFGQSLLVVGDATLIRVHIHTERPGDVLNCASEYGQLDRVKAENMDLQQAASFDEALDEAGQVPGPPEKTAPQFGVIAVTTGPGLQEVFASLGAAVVHGGQSMNPSAGDIARAIESSPEEWAIVLPNNSNVVMAARQAAQQVDKTVRVIPTRTVPQGIGAMLAFNPNQDVDANVAAMEAAAGQITTIEITRAVRDAVVGEVSIREGQYISLLNDELVAGDGDPNTLVLRLLERLAEDEPEVATVYVGHHTPAKMVEELVEEIARKHPELEVETVQGGQELYDYIISVE